MSPLLGGNFGDNKQEFIIWPKLLSSGSFIPLLTDARDGGGRHQGPLPRAPSLTLMPQGAIWIVLPYC